MAHVVARIVSTLAGLSSVLIVVGILAAIGIYVVVVETNTVSISKVNLETNPTFQQNCSGLAFQLTSGTQYSSLTSSVFSGTLSLTKATGASTPCPIFLAQLNTPKFAVVSDNLPLSVSFGSSQTLTITMNTPTSYQGSVNLTLYVSKAAAAQATGLTSPVPYSGSLSVSSEPTVLGATVPLSVPLPISSPVVPAFGTSLVAIGRELAPVR